MSFEPLAGLRTQLLALLTWCPYGSCTPRPFTSSQGAPGGQGLCLPGSQAQLGDPHVYGLKIFFSSPRFTFKPSHPLNMSCHPTWLQLTAAEKTMMGWVMGGKEGRGVGWKEEGSAGPQKSGAELTLLKQNERRSLSVLPSQGN